MTDQTASRKRKQQAADKIPGEPGLVEAIIREREVHLEKELADIKLLQAISAEITHENDLVNLYEKLVDGAMAIMRSDYASMQMFYPERGSRGELQLLASRGFSAEAAKFWEWVRADSSCSCGKALSTRARVIVPDVEACDYMAGTADLVTMLQTGIRAMHTTPLFSRGGKLVGMISTHWRRLHQPSERELRLFDILARQAADLIERRQAEEALRQREAQLEMELADSKLLQALSAEMSQDAEATVLYQKLVDGARHLMRSDSAGIQMLYPERGAGELLLLANSGFSPEAGEFWKWINANNGTSCARALCTGERVIVADIEQSEFTVGTMDFVMMRQAGIKAMQTTPLYSRGGRLLGMISTHWRRIYQPSERDLRLLDILARQAADLIERKKSEEALKCSEERMRAVFNSAAIGVALLTPDARFLQMNEAFCSITGYSAEELRALDCATLTHPDDIGRMQTMIDDLLAGRTSSFVIEKRYFRKNGALIFVQNSVSVAHDQTGAVTHLVALCQDITERRQAEAALRQSEERYRNIFQTSRVSIWEEDYSAVKRMVDGLKHAGVRDIRGYLAEHPEFVRQAIDSVRIIDVNNSTLRLFGAQDRQELLSSLNSVFVPETAVAFAEELLAIAEERAFFETDAVMRTLQGERLHVQVTINFPPPGGGFERVLVTLMDITGRKQAEAALRQSEARLRFVLDSMPPKIFTAGPDGDMDYLNQQWMQFTGLSFEQLANGWSRLIHPDDVEEYLRAWRHSIETGHTFELEHRIRRHDSEYRWHMSRARAMRDADGRIVMWIGSSTDVHEAKQLQEAFRRSEVYFRELMQNMPLVVWTSVPDGNVDFVNRRWLEMTGQTLDYVRTNPEAWMIALHPEDRERAGAIYLDGIRSGKGFTMEARFHRVSDGTYRWHLNRCVPLHGKSGNIRKFLGTCTDIEDQKRLEAALLQNDRRKDEFLATLAHELRNPLAPIRQSAKLLKSPQLGAGDAQWARDVIDRQVQAMGLLLDDLLDISRISSGKLELRKEPVDVASVVESAVELSRPLIDAKQHKLHIQLPAGPVRLEADPLRLAQIISNLLTNAAKYTDPRGAIRLRAERDGEELIVRVTDNGIGISADMLPKVFEMFSQAKPALERTEGGLGIGLALVYGFATLHGGSVHAHSEGPGRGSEFTLRLPLGTGSFEPKVQPAMPDIQPVNLRKILVIDDNRDMAETLAALIKIYGHEVRVSFSGREALQLAETFHPEIVLLDIGMPELNGYEIAQHIRTRLWGRRATLVAVTGWGQEDDKRRALAAGFDYHLRKPIDPDFLQVLLKEPRTKTAPV